KKEFALPAYHKYYKYFNESDFLSDRILKVHGDNLDHYGYYDLYEKKEIVPPCYKDIQKTVNSRYMWVSKTKKINTSASNPASLYDTTLQREIDLSSYSMVEFIKGKNMLQIKKNGLWGVFDLVKNAEIIPAKYEQIKLVSGTTYMQCELNNAYAIYDISGKEMIPASRRYTSIVYQPSRNRFSYRMNGYYGECDKYGRELTRVKEPTLSQKTNSNKPSSVKITQKNSTTKSGLLYSGTIYQSIQGYNETTGQYVGSGPDAEFGVEIYNDYIIVGSSRYDYTRNTDNGSERVYEGTDFLRNKCYYYVNPKTFAMRMVKVYGNPYMGRNEYVSYQISNGTTTFQHNNPAYNNSGNNNYGNSGGYNNSNDNDNNKNNRQRRECSLCHGKGRIVRDSPVPTYGNDSRVRCNECGGYFMRSTGHSHVTCTLCHGRGYLE
ncbi:MAG: hypothetical protein ACI3YC_00550, partial [Alloprevotella sp.]